ncbi:MBL fold metallo-hydrolase [Salibacterium halotolerans]|uniref:Ribonuclease BN, tRNA processing enzyme n=1 Tax=Salibacterium halotolerans TaxID=1884432 RepID=A0A1I5SWN6_9BACI|nr:MBL fold metallo-hydrolase [Salibacterium halotolerans]SFP74646.1 Ribonuclease BN, tRNA processing enzyme [Salibacterium halotolerans]
MKVTVIGFWHAFPEAGEAASGYLIEEGDYKILIDCGSGVISQLQQYSDLGDIDAVIISHYHNDHVGDIGALHYFRLLQPVIIDAPQQPLTIYGHNEDPAGFDNLSFQGTIPTEDYAPDQPLEIGPFTFTFFKTTHPVPCYAMRVQTETAVLFYSADTGFSTELAHAACGADLMIAESTAYKGGDGASFGHMTSEEAGQMAGLAKVPHLLLTHLPHYGTHDDMIGEAQIECPDTKVEKASSGWNKTLS